MKLWIYSKNLSLNRVIKQRKPPDCSVSPKAVESKFWTYHVINLLLDPTEFTFTTAVYSAVWIFFRGKKFFHIYYYQILKNFYKHHLTFIELLNLNLRRSFLLLFGKGGSTALSSLISDYKDSIKLRLQKNKKHFL